MTILLIAVACLSFAVILAGLRSVWRDVQHYREEQRAFRALYRTQMWGQVQRHLHPVRWDQPTQADDCPVHSALQPRCLCPDDSGPAWPGDRSDF